MDAKATEDRERRSEAISTMKYADFLIVALDIAVKRSPRRKKTRLAMTG